MHWSCVCVRNRSLVMWHSRQKSRRRNKLMMILSYTFKVFIFIPPPAYKHFTMWLQHDIKTSGEDSLQVSIRQTASLYLSDHNGADDPWVIPWSLPPHTTSPSLSHLLTAQRCGSNRYFFQTLPLPCSPFSCRHVMFRSTVQRISFPPVSI